MRVELSRKLKIHAKRDVAIASKEQNEPLEKVREKRKTKEVRSTRSDGSGKSITHKKPQMGHRRMQAFSFEEDGDLR